MTLVVCDDLNTSTDPRCQGVNTGHDSTEGRRPRGHHGQDDPPVVEIVLVGAL